LRAARKRPAIADMAAIPSSKAAGGPRPLLGTLQRRVRSARLGALWYKSPPHTPRRRIAGGNKTFSPERGLEHESTPPQFRQNRFGRIATGNKLNFARADEVCAVRRVRRAGLPVTASTRRRRRRRRRILFAIESMQACGMLLYHCGLGRGWLGKMGEGGRRCLPHLPHHNATSWKKKSHLVQNIVHSTCRQH